MTIDLNAWHRRNLFFLSKAEQIFLSDDDYGQLLPRGYRTPNRGWITFYMINIITFVLFLLLALIYAIAWKLHAARFCEGWLLPMAVLVVGIALTWFNMRKQEQSAQRNFKELFQDKTPNMTTPGNHEDARAN